MTSAMRVSVVQITDDMVMLHTYENMPRMIVISLVVVRLHG